MLACDQASPTNRHPEEELNMDNVTKRIARVSKHSSAPSVIKIADIAVLAGITAAGGVLPGALYEFSKFGFGKIRDYIHARDDRRIFEFHQQLLYRDGAIDVEVLARELEDASFHALLQACLSDIEDEKTVAYANLARSIVFGRVKSYLRRHYILALKDISWEDLDTLRKIHVVTKNSIIPDEGGGSVSAKQLLANNAPGSTQQLSVINLSAKGFIDNSEAKLSSLGIDFVEACSADDDLIPSVFGFEVWTGQVCDAYVLDGSASSMRILDLVQSKLRSKGIKCNTSMEGALDRREKNMYATCALVIYRHGKMLQESRQENLKYLLGSKPVVQILIDDDDGENPSERLFLGETSITNSGDATAAIREAVNMLINQINIRPQANKKA